MITNSELKKHVNELFCMLKPSVCNLYCEHDFDEKWSKVACEFSSWTDDVGDKVSGLTINLELLELACKEFGDISEKLKNNMTIVDRLLDGFVLTVGDSYKVKLPNNTIEEGVVIERRLTEDFGVLFVIEKYDTKEKIIRKYYE